MSIAIKVENLSKAYQLGQVGTGTISKDLERWFASIRGKEDPFLKIGETNDQHTKSKSDLVWSLKDINFEIEQGDAVGIIGRNGAGKSTLLKILSKITSPTTGRVTGKGRIASLLEVGTGFHPELTGRENIYLNGAILGMRKKEITRKFEEIVDFAGVERYIDTPVKRYSSGMYVRLAFAVAAHLESEILIVDEVLAVGDAEFQKKCLGKMGQVSKGEGRTVLFVSHNMGSVQQLCKTGIVLQNGLIMHEGKIKDVIKTYTNVIISNIKNYWMCSQITDTPQIVSVNTILEGNQPKLKLLAEVTTKSQEHFAPGFIAFDIQNGFGVTIAQAIPNLEPFMIFNGKSVTKNYEIELNGFVPDTYSLSVWIGAHNDRTYDWQREIVSFEIIDSPQSTRKFPHSSTNGFIITESQILNTQ